MPDLQDGESVEMKGSNEKSFPDTAAAQKHATTQITEKTGKGYDEAR